MIAGSRRPLSRLAEVLVGGLLFRRVPVQPQLVALMRREAVALDGVGVNAAGKLSRVAPFRGIEMALTFGIIARCAGCPVTQGTGLG